MSAPRRLSALIVNFDSGAFALGCARSILREWHACGRAREDLEVVVVDNASPRDQNAWLAQIESLGARVVRSAENGGYARGMNLALRQTRGEPDDAVGVLNPDLYFLPGSLAELFACLARHPDAGAIAPRTVLDPACTFELPPNVLPTPCEHVRASLAQVSPRVAEACARTRARGALEVWNSNGDLETELLSGACLFLRRATIDRIGGLFDERYPLYFEDTDLCLRLSAAGLRMWQARESFVVHHWARSSGVGEEFGGEPARRFAVAQRAFLERWYGERGVTLARECDAFVGSIPPSRRWRPFHAFTHQGELAEPFAIELPRRVRFVVELSLSPLFPLAAGALGEGTSWRCPASAWEWFFRGRYFVRALEQKSGELLAAVSFDKPARSRTDALDPDRDFASESETRARTKGTLLP